MILESPYYGSRRPPWQEGSKLKRVSDLLALGRVTIEESLYLLAWAQRQEFRHLGEGTSRSCFGYQESLMVSTPKIAQSIYTALDCPLLYT